MTYCSTRTACKPGSDRCTKAGRELAAAAGRRQAGGGGGGGGGKRPTRQLGGLVTAVWRSAIPSTGRHRQRLSRELLGAPADGSCGWACNRLLCSDVSPQKAQICRRARLKREDATKSRALAHSCKAVAAGQRSSKVAVTQSYWRDHQPPSMLDPAAAAAAICPRRAPACCPI